MDGRGILGLALLVMVVGRLWGGFCSFLITAIAVGTLTQTTNSGIIIIKPFRNARTSIRYTTCSINNNPFKVFQDACRITTFTSIRMESIC